MSILNVTIKVALSCTNLHMEMHCNFGIGIGKEWGNPDGDPVIGLHGWVDNCATFDRLAPLLPLSKLRFISLDFPGHGHSSHLPAGKWYSWTDYLGSVIKSVSHLKLDKFSFLAHSMGGQIAYLYAAMYPDKVKRMVALDIYRPFPEVINRVVIEPQKGHQKDWDFTKICKSFYEYLLKLENAPPLHSDAGEPMEDLVKKTILYTGDFMTADSAQILLKRGTRVVSKNPDLFAITRDPRLRIYDFHVYANLTYQFCKSIKADLLIIVPQNGVVVNTSPHIRKEILKIYEKNLKVFRVDHVKGLHHEHLNDPNEMAPIIFKFLLTSQ